jgi:hypothetical protein
MTTSRLLLRRIQASDVALSAGCEPASLMYYEDEREDFRLREYEEAHLGQCEDARLERVMEAAYERAEKERLEQAMEEACEKAWESRGKN